jgi:ribosomal-protein-alanine N-acetyltransferase
MELNKNIFLEGVSIVLRILTETDVQGNYSKWLNDPEITEFNSHGRFPMTIDKLKQYVRNSNESGTALVLAVVNKNTHEHIGNISLQAINWIDKNAEISFLLGEKKYWGKGIMYEAGSMLIKHGFDILNLHRIYCGTSFDNKGMQKLAEKLGFIKEGVRKEAMFKKGKYLDVVDFGLVRK